MGIETSRSRAHRWVEGVLDLARISYQSEQPFHPYVADLYLPEWHLVVEVDGPQHSAPRDAARDAFLLEHFGLHVHHIVTTKRGWQQRDKVLHSLLEFITEHAWTIEERMTLWRTKSLQG